MVTIVTVPTTAAGLLALVQPFGPAVENGELTFATDPPLNVEPMLGILHTGVRAVIVRRPWWGHVESGKGGRFTRVKVAELDPEKPIPPGTVLLSVEGDSVWDRVHPSARIDFPMLFAG